MVAVGAGQADTLEEDVELGEPVAPDESAEPEENITEPTANQER